MPRACVARTPARRARGGADLPCEQACEHRVPRYGDPAPVATYGGEGECHQGRRDHGGWVSVTTDGRRPGEGIERDGRRLFLTLRRFDRRCVEVHVNP